MTSTSIYTSVIPVSQSKTYIFVSKAKLVHGDLYNYVYVNYINCITKIKIECKLHGIFEQIPSKHLSGSGCSLCGRISLSKMQASNSTEFISKAMIIHDDVYNYNVVEYVNSKTKVKIECKLHGEFLQSPSNHLSGQGCSKCKKTKISQSMVSNTKEFLMKAKIVHNELYSYELVEYINVHAKVKIRCKVHGVYEQTPGHHLQGNGCPKCRHTISKTSMKWLDSLNISDMIFEYRLPENNKKPVDGYSPSTNTIYQFHGDYWHGNLNNPRFKSKDIHPVSKKTYGELYEKTIESDLWILSLGYNLVTMWESDFNTHSI